ncbi:putative silver efflux pump [Congregibacter litoralis KT71]|uniref:Putative silver efflux pump n=1 Tax=Congregibacter litoralis KT71 TaxID=314285 RepID=V7HV77_9GAMM|nr:putative silver efflux pump [Congregibacter litoralis KT71]
MLDRILHFSIHRSGVVILLVLLLACLGGWSFTKLPIDAVPDITNVQVMINTEAPGFTPLEVEQRISYPLETALAGIAGSGPYTLDFALRPVTGGSDLQR